MADATRPSASIDTKQNPFSLYDLLGYLIPGAAFLYLVHWLLWLSNITIRPYVPGESLLLSQPFIPFAILAYIQRADYASAGFDQTVRFV